MCQADGSKRATQRGFGASLVLGGLDEATEFIVHDIGCGVDVLLGYNWLAAHDLHFLFESAQVSFCAEKGCPDPQRGFASMLPQQRRPHPRHRSS